MKKINITPKTGPYRENLMDTHLHITRCQFWPLGNLWKARNERNWLWRFYFNEAPGSGLFLGDKRIEFTPDNFYLMPPGTPLKTWQDNDLRQFFILFDTMLTNINVNENIYTFPMTDQIKDFIYKIDNELTSENLTPTIQALSLAICSIALSQIPAADFLPRDIPPAVTFAITQLKSRFATDISIEHLADASAIAPYSLIRLFKKHVGITPYQFLTELRIERASQLLANSEMPIDLIATRVGYKDRFHFSRLFKSKTGSNPAAYRKDNKR